MTAGSPYVAVIGPGRADGEVLEAAEAVGRELARRGATVVCGGRGSVEAGNFMMQALRSRVQI